MKDLLITITALCAVAAATTGTLTFLAVRSVRRRYRAARERLRGTSVTSPGWWTAQNRRHRLWRAVSSAEHAVALARGSDAPVGDLPSLTRQLRSAATGVDSILRASAERGVLRPDDRAAYDQVVAAAADIHQAALSSLRTTSRADTEPLLSAVQIEVAALAAGVRAATR